MTSQIIDSDRRPCLHSRRFRNSQGYPVRAIGPRGAQQRHYEHRWVYEQAHGPIPEHLTIDHLCHGWDLSCPGGPTCLHRRCVEITHLEAVTRRENTLRGRGPAAVHAAMTHCKYGHELTPDNCYARPDGHSRRRCLTCARQAALAQYYAKKAAQ